MDCEEYREPVGELEELRKTISRSSSAIEQILRAERAMIGSGGDDGGAS